ncbi:probable E3 ubiquitin-protein ligase HERC3 [Megalops cyprinoides]|uniref:probable E3 ubiquitin-protein ligase HERC3 n=1 Tax=Megalops cyprinoides TaxID=118141 RepID=UPI001864CF1F|nr:probable E3 ubiquitin-protein ligase HERC3 [Megalops cyprinoides]
MGEKLEGKPKALTLKKERIRSLTCGASHIVLVSERSTVFQLNCDETPSIPRPCIKDRQVIQVACGDHHTIALSKEGEVFTWGSNSNGQLGLDHVVSSPLTPRHVTLLSGMPLSQISAGGDQSFALSSSGAVFGWGKNNTGQLGLGDMEDRYCPTPVDSLNLKRTVSISCGEEHTAILNKGGLVFTFGSGRYGQLGHNSNRNELRPRLVAELWGSRVTQLACGRHHTLAYVSFSNTIYSFGRGEQRQLGNGQTSNQNVPLPVQLSPEVDRGVTIIAGGNQSFVMTSPGQIGSVVQNRLIPSLRLLPANVEALRVYLILPELLRVLQTPQRELLIVDFADSIVKLRPLHLEILEGLWFRLPDTFFKTVVKVFHSVSTWYLHQIRTEYTDHWALVKTVQVLEKLYKVNHRAGRKIDDSNFYISEVKRFIPLVKFEEEDGIDEGGVSQEFFSVIAKKLSLELRVFQLFEESRLVWFTPEGHCEHDTFYLLGILCGMALYNFCVVNFHFPLALFKKLLGFTATLEDLEELSPTEARSLQKVLDEDDEDVVEDLYLDFTVKGQEIMPGGKEKPVTKSNRQQYVDAYVDFVFNKSVSGQFEKFFKGFSKGCPNEKWRMFLPEELMALLTGNVDYEWGELKKNAKYVGYRATDPNIQNFWTVFDELSEEQKKHFLSFMTGCDRLPVGGLSKMRMTIVDPNKDNPDRYYPVASTCFYMLCLPNYSSINVLREKFMHAITFYEAFGEL